MECIILNAGMSYLFYGFKALELGLQIRNVNRESGLELVMILLSKGQGQKTPRKGLGATNKGSQ